MNQFYSRVGLLGHCLLSLWLALVCVAAQAQDAPEKARKPKDRRNKLVDQANKTDEQELGASMVQVYKSIDGTDLNLYVFLPEGHHATDRRPGIVFFFGGGWTNGSPKQFAEHCKHLASRGMVAITADYRVASRHGVKAVSCVRDAKSAIRWTRENATKLGIDPDRIVAGGGSAGGHLAACAGVIEGFDEPTENAAISSRPNALALFNPALVLAGIEGDSPAVTKRLQELPTRMGVDPVELSPFHHVGQHEPPTIIFHGIADKTVPYDTAQKFADAMKTKGNDCELIGYEGQDHGFFNHGRGDGSGFEKTIASLDQFLERIGYLSP